MKKSVRVLTLVAIMALISPPLMAADGDLVDQPGPTFTNQAQAKHAENLAEQMVNAEDVLGAYAEYAANDEIDSRAKAAALEAYQDAGGDPADLKHEELMEYPSYAETYVAMWDRAKGVGWQKPEEIDTAFEAAYERFKTAGVPEGYSIFYAQAFADAVGAELPAIYEMRYVDKKGWGVIAKELGVDPKYLGLGHTKKFEVEGVPAVPEGVELGEEIREATRRNVQTGWDNGKGNTNRNNEKKNQNVNTFEVIDPGDVQKSNNGNSSSNRNNNSSANSSSNSNNGNSSASGNSDKNNNGKSSSNSNSSKNKSNNGKANGKK